MPTHGRRRTDVEGARSSTLRALVVDDAEQDRLYVATLLRRIGFAVTVANDGEAARDLVMQDAFDLLVIDCEMPRMNGLELVTHVRGSEHCCDSYALMLTGRDDIETKIGALRAGFDDFLVKSMSESELLAKVGAARRLIVRQRRLDTAVRELYGLATRDELTGLFNRRFFFDDAQKRLSQGGASGVVLFDLDRFKHVNDTFGHLAGDRILRDVGSLFLRRTRHEDLSARYGGDEFVMLVASALPDEIERLAARIAEEIGAMQWTIGNESVRVGMSSGFAASVLLEQPSLEQLLDAADRDLYKNKWLRANPDGDPALYEYSRGKDGRTSDLSEFRVPRVDEGTKDASG
jgi:two-component system, cell cycle response regulator